MAWSAITTFPYAPDAFTQPVSQLALPLLSSLHLSPNMGRLAGLSEWASLVPPALIGVGLLWLVHVGKNSLAAFLGIVIVGVVIWFGPAPIHNKVTLNSRVGIECLLDYEKGAEALCNSVGAGFNSRRCRCVQRRARQP
jgi:hypothetical protein